MWHRFNQKKSSIVEESGSENFVIFACVLNRKKSQRALNRSTEFNIMNIITKVTFIVSKCTNWMKSQNPRVGVKMNVHISRTHTHTPSPAIFNGSVAQQWNAKLFLITLHAKLSANVLAFWYQREISTQFICERKKIICLPVGIVVWLRQKVLIGLISMFASYYDDW